MLMEKFKASKPNYNDETHQAPMWWVCATVAAFRDGKKVTPICFFDITDKLIDEYLELNLKFHNWKSKEDYYNELNRCKLAVRGYLEECYKLTM